MSQRRPVLSKTFYGRVGGYFCQYSTILIAATVSYSQRKIFTNKVSSLTEEMLSARVERANLKLDLDEMTVLVQRMKGDAGKSMCDLSAEAQKTFEDMVWAIMLKFQADLVDGSK